MKPEQSPQRWQRSHEPITWSLFGGGGMVLAFVAPALILITGLLMPFVFGAEPEAVYRGALTVASHPIGKLLLLVAIALPLYHCVHRIHHGLHDLHIHGPNPLMVTLFYGGATLLSLVTAVWLLML
jgi:fumarate reductase subunit D